MAASKELITKIVLRGQADGSLAKAFKTLSNYSDTSLNKLKKIGETATKAFKVVGTAAVAAGVAAAKSAIDFESAFAGVKKTVDETKTTTYEDLANGIRKLSKVTPTAATEIAAVAEAAGQLGIKADDILNFSKTMIDLGESTNLSSDEAATSIAKLFNVTGTSMKKVSNFGSTLVALGNNAATTESDILAMATRIAGSGSQIGLTEQQILALSTALSSVGIEAEMGGSAISTTMSQIDKDVAMNSANLAVWAKTAGMSTSQFASAWKNDAYGALQKVISGMASTRDEGGNLNILLSELGINGIRQGDTLKRLANASGLMADMTSLANTAWTENSALTKEANTRYATMASKLQMFKNKITDAAITVGNKLLPIIDQLLKKFDEIDMDAVAEKICKALQWVIDNFDLVKAGLITLAAAFAAFKIGSFINTIAGATKEVKMLISCLSNSGIISKAAQALATYKKGAEGLSVAQTAAYSVKSLGTAIKNSSLVTGAVNIFGKLKTAFLGLNAQTIAATASQWAHNAALYACPILLIVAAVALLTTGIIALIKNWDKVKVAAVNCWNKTKEAVSTAGTWMKNFFTQTLPNALNSMVQWFAQLPSKIGNWLTVTRQKISQWGANLWTKAKEIGGKFINGVVNFFKQLPYKIGYYIGFAIGKVIVFGQKLWKFATTTIPRFIGKVVEWFKQLPGKVWTWLTNTIAKVKNWGARMISLGKQKASQFITAVINWVKQLPSKISTWFTNTVKKVVSWGSQMVSKGKAAAAKLVSGITNTIKNLPSKMKSIGKNIVKGIWNGIKNAKDWLIGRVKSFASGIVDGIKAALGIKSPSRVMMKLAKYVPQGFGIGIVKNAKYAVGAIKAMGGKIVNAASKINPTISSSIGLKKFGTGGTVTRPQAAIVGDAPETIVPHGNTPRNRSLLAEAARGVGASIGGATYNFTFAPVINGGNAAENRAMIQEEEEEFERKMDAWLAKNGRLAF